MAPAGAFVADVVTSSERLAEIQARRERITPGPWSFYRDDLWCGATAEELQRADDIYAQPDVYFSDEAEEIFERAEHVFHGDPVCPTDAEFIAAAPADVDWLLAEVEALTRENAKLKRRWRNRSAELMRGSDHD